MMALKILLAWAWPDLNRRPLGYEPSALTGLSYRPKRNAPPTGLEPVTFWLLLYAINSQTLYQLSYGGSTPTLDTQ